ncbi:unnamed protein product [Miscanthus lutarioriparius]|uniref:Uncharacterized protein n=1 Tax=Miscanthus lutarioriparius TaxID=422564 RepID=A0A811QJH3_9POAL|nr:unnamed protein product [Miscanthus lutarioriparius]
MALDADNILLHIKRTLHSSVRLAYQSASDYPGALGIGMLLLFLHKLCPSLFTFFLSSSPVFLLTALLLGALLSYGEPSAPVIREEALQGQKKSLSPESRTSITECSVVEEVQNVAVTHMSRSLFESPVVCMEEATSDRIFHDTHRDEDSIVTSVSADTVGCAEASELAKNEVVIVEREEHVKEICDKVELQQFQSSAAEGVSVEEPENVAVKVNVGTRFKCPVMYTGDKTFEGVLLIDTQCDQGNVTSLSTDTVLCAEPSGFGKNNGIIAEREEEEHVKEICEQVAPPQQFESTITERCHDEYEVNHQYQFGELMSSCWQPVTRQDPCSDSESDLTESSSDASITDIIPMLDELNPPVDLGTSHPGSALRDNLNAGSSDEDEDEDDSEEEDGNLSSDDDVEEEKRDDESSWKGFVDPNSLDTDKNGNLESLMARRKAKNVLKFELDRRLMDMQAADAVQKMEEASRFRVQVPSISTPRPDPSNDSEDTVELPQVPDSAPSALLPWRKPFDIPFDQIVDHDSHLQETWTPRSGFSSAQGRKRDSLYVRPSTYPRHHNGIKLEKSEFSEKVAVDNHSESDSEQPLDNNGKLFGSLEPHIGDEIKILSAAISDVCVLEANHGINEGSTDSINGTNSFYVQKSMSSTSDVNDSISAGNEQSVLCSLSEEHNTEEHTVEVEEEDSMSEVNSLFKCRMEEVLVQSISESGIGQPLMVKLEHELSDNFLHAKPGIPLIEARSVEDLNSQFAQLNREALLAPSASIPSCDDDQPIQDRPSEALPVENGDTEDGHSSDRSLDDSLVAVKVVEGEGGPKELLTEDGGLPVLKASSVEEMSSLFRHLEEAAAGPALMRAGRSESEHMSVGQHTGETQTDDCGVLAPDAKPAWDDTNPTYVQLSIGGGDKMKIPEDGEVIVDNSAKLNSDAGTSGSNDTKVFEAKESLESA